MTANEVYKLLRPIVGPWFRANGFKLSKGYLTYQKPVGDSYLCFRIQCNSSGWEKYKGSSLMIAVQVSDQREIDETAWRRLTAYLTFEQLEFIRARQNQVLASIPQPPVPWIKTIVSAFEKSFRDPQPYIDAYLSDWRPINKPYAPSDQIWFRYFTKEDVRAWALLLLKHVQRHHESVLRTAA